MRFVAPMGVLAFAIASLGTAAEAYTLDQAAQPAELPPAGYSKDVYVDSRGCAYVRASIGSTVNWVPRLARDRETVICGMTPTNAVASVAAAPPPPPAPPAPAPLPVTEAVATSMAATQAPVAPKPVAVAAPAATPVAAPSVAAPAAVIRTMTVTCPSDGSSARVRIGSSTVRVTCPAGMTQTSSRVITLGDGSRTRLITNPPEMPAPILVADAATSGSGRVFIGGRAPGEPNLGFGNGYGITHSAPPMDPVPEAVWPAPVQVAPSGGAVVPTPGLPPFGNGYGLDPVEGAGRVHVPAGYRPAWDDDRLNPNRGPQTAYGDAQMATVLDTTKVPMPAATPVPARTLARTKGQPVAAPTGARYVQVGAFGEAGNAQNALARIKSLGLGGATSRTGSGLTLVMAGPFASTAELQRALGALRGYFPDAYARG